MQWLHSVEGFVHISHSYSNTLVYITCHLKVSLKWLKLTWFSWRDTGRMSSGKERVSPGSSFSLDLTSDWKKKSLARLPFITGREHITSQSQTPECIAAPSIPLSADTALSSLLSLSHTSHWSLAFSQSLIFLLLSLAYSLSLSTPPLLSLLSVNNFYWNSLIVSWAY